MDKEKRREYDRRRREDAKLAYAAFIEFYPLSLDDLPDEQWRPITDKYQISTFGRVKSFKWTKPRILTPVLRGEYLSVNLYLDGKLKKRLIHVLVAETFIPNPDLKPEVNHDDGRKFNCHVSNLYWATGSENQRHAVKNGLAKSGEEHPQAKLTKEQIIYIRENPDNLTQEQLAEMFGITKSTISEIQTGKTYENAGGNIRKAQKRSPNVTDETKQKIRADWATGLYTKASLARKFGYTHTTIINIINAG